MGEVQYPKLTIIKPSKLLIHLIYLNAISYIFNALEKYYYTTLTIQQLVFHSHLNFQRSKIQIHPFFYLNYISIYIKMCPMFYSNAFVIWKLYIYIYICKIRVAMSHTSHACLHLVKLTSFHPSLRLHKPPQKVNIIILVNNISI